MNRGRLLIVSGPSGVGKGTVVRQLRQRCANVVLSVSATTRPPRPEDVEGVTYSFKTHEVFEQMIAGGAFLEYASYAGNYYGTPLDQLEDKLSRGLDVVLEIEVQGALQVKKRRPDAIAVFVAAPSFQELERRLTGRGDTPPDVRAIRLKTARWEYRQAEQYDYIVVNDSVDRCTDEVLAILTAEKCRAKYRKSILKEDNENALPPDV